jgi:hypothetical protein
VFKKQSSGLSGKPLTAIHPPGDEGVNMTTRVKAELRKARAIERAKSTNISQEEIRAWITKLSEAHVVSMREIREESHGMDLTPHSLEALDKFIEGAWPEGSPDERKFNGVVLTIGGYVADVIQRNNKGIWKRSSDANYDFEFETNAATGFRINPWKWAIRWFQDGVPIAKAYELTTGLSAAVQIGDHEKADQLLIQVVNDERSKTGDLSEARALRTRALSAQQRGDFQEAKSLLQRALPIYERVLGLEHPDTLMCLNGLDQRFRSSNHIRRP